MKGKTFMYKSILLEKPSKYTAKRFVARTWHIPDTETEQVRAEKDWMKRESLFTDDNAWIWKGKQTWNDGPTPKQLFSAYGRICGRCKDTFLSYEVQVDQIILRVKNRRILRMQTDLENLQVLCTNCHRAKQLKKLIQKC